MTQDQIQEIARKQAQTVKNGATFLTIAGTVLVAIACSGITFTNNINYMVVLIVGFLIAMFGFVSSKQ
jgi:hypothetical protein